MTADGWKFRNLVGQKLNQKVLSVVYLKTASRCTTIYVYSWSQRVVHFQEVDLVLCSSGARIRTRGAICMLLTKIANAQKGLSMGPWFAFLACILLLFGPHKSVILTIPNIYKRK